MGDYGSTVPPLRSTPVGNPSHLPPVPNEISVLVTGFGPFKTNLVNASYLIASSLPASFAFPSPDETNPATSDGDRRVSIHVHPSPIPVAYATVRETLPVILEQYAATHGGKRPDLVVHIGIASPRPYYSVESQAHRDDYIITDIEGRNGFEDGERRWKEMGLPAILRPGLVAHDEQHQNNAPAASTSASMSTPYPPDNNFLKTWKSLAPADLDLRVSQDPGRYLCDFIFYTSMSLALLAGQDRNVLFLHVPGASEDADIERGKKVALALIKTMVTCWIDEKHVA
ncbi:hypothetical protein N7462_011628 [Penicillium macrosclerotiorum]|uniref:uncharacterized protein n=1 Tax=Penicillium macrosclerotiorum TaxID=303699 RepID=UPI002547874A|nr:uncharacterized protein N7462_011628 [Penicillium macrosclerotiorum]KAJ5662702.1 hypothetical protein N7462_011628 [Penicillium macrosclerotiorum]